jgi:hypothetical protein
MRRAGYGGSHCPYASAYEISCKKQVVPLASGAAYGLRNFPICHIVDKPNTVTEHYIERKTKNRRHTHPRMHQNKYVQIRPLDKLPFPLQPWSRFRNWSVLHNANLITCGCTCQLFCELVKELVAFLLPQSDKLCIVVLMHNQISVCYSFFEWPWCDLLILTLAHL